MKLKFLFSIVIVSLLGLAFLSQLSLANAQEGNGGPVTSPITPITYFKFILSGKVSYKGFFLNWLKPASNVTISIVDAKYQTLTTVKTNASGFYSIKLKQGVYKVTPSDAINTKFTPNFRLVNLDTRVTDVNFVGKLATQSAK